MTRNENGDGQLHTQCHTRMPRCGTIFKEVSS